jgi:transaldolase/glucose-6-phosphate isomerase
MVQDRNPLYAIQSFGQSIWLDFLRRRMLENGDLQRYIAEDGLLGMTSNPSIFEKAIAGSHDYDRAIHFLALEDKSVEEIYQALTVEDVRNACDLFRPVYDQTGGMDGFVSLEVSPHLARDTQATIVEARRLWSMVACPNLMIKVPGTREGLPAIQQLISESINVNVTLLFSLPRYREVAQAYLGGLEALFQQGKPLQSVASVASFFLSRIDVLVDPMLEKIVQGGGKRAALAASLKGQVAIASAKVAYQIYKEIYSKPEFKKLADQGGQPQRLLWASTSTKDASFSDVKYVEALIGAHTVNTVPLETLNAYRDHGQPAARLEQGLDEAHKVLDSLSELGIDIAKVTEQLEDEGVNKFIHSFDRLMDTLQQARATAQDIPVDPQELSLAEAQSTVGERIQQLVAQDYANRLWKKDASLWADDPKIQQQIKNALGWLHVAEKMESNLGELEAFSREVEDAGFQHVVHMGMGGSSLAPLVIERTFTGRKAGLPLTVLDTTDPFTVQTISRQVPLEKTLFIVASKSGTTAEPLAFGEYFYQRLQELKPGRAGENFVAITDPGTPLVELAAKRNFRRIFLNFPDIGGRYSALSYFGLLPASLAGVDVSGLLESAMRMQHASASCVKGAENPGLALGAVLGELASQGCDKVTFLIPEPIASLGMWLEQLLAESTGKQGRGLVPVVSEPLGAPPVYGHDRVFVHYRLAGEREPHLESAVQALQHAGQPLVTIRMNDRLDLGQEFMRWEIATAVAGAILKINAFDQPNVQESKDNTNRLLAGVRQKGSLPDERPALVEKSLSLFVENKNGSIAGSLSQLFIQAKAGSYLALLAYLPEQPEVERALQSLRLRLRDRLQIATTLGYGPRYLHSTGQLHKGGPNSGLFLMVTAGDNQDVPIPGEPYTFGVFKQAQALGDMQSLHQHGRRIARIHLGNDLSAGLEALQNAVETALQA